MSQANQSVTIAPDTTLRRARADAPRVGASAPTTAQGAGSTSPIVVIPAPVAARSKESDSRMLDQMVVSGAATGAASGDTLLRKVRTDSTATAKTTVYQVAPGVAVTLTESVYSTSTSTFSARPQELAAAASAPEAQRSTATSKAGPRAASPAAAPPPPLPPAADVGRATLQPGSRTNTISWIDPVRGKRYTLSGPFSVQQLEALKPRVVPQSR